MSQRKSGYARKDNDLYETPEWVTDALIPHLPSGIKHVWEPACGSGMIASALTKHGFSVSTTDITGDCDFLAQDHTFADAIITNPPYNKAREFIENAIKISPVTAMLLRADYDHAKTRAHLFSKCPSFSKKIALTKRIVFFEKPGAAPSFNHAWFLWDRNHNGAPTIAYAPDTAHSLAA